MEDWDSHDREVPETMIDGENCMPDGEAPEGSGIGALRTSQLHGEVFYLAGGSKRFFVLKALHRVVYGRPLLLSGLALIWGFLKPWMARRETLVSEVEARHYRRLLRPRLRAGSGASNNGGD